MFFSGKILTSEQLHHIAAHRYRAQGTTLLDPIMQTYWCWLAERLPAWLNGNVITIAGLTLNVASFICLVLYSPTATKEAPRWCYAFAAITMFLYQTCDALDGKQCARHLKLEDWNLAEVFDHGCDSVSAVFVTIQLAICMQIGDRPALTLILMFASIFMFFTAHWQTYISGVVRFGTVDVTESELSLASAYLLTAISGTKLWFVKILGYELREVMIVAIVITGIIKFINHAIFISRRECTVTVAGTSILSPVWNIAIVATLAIATKTSTDLYDTQPCIFLVIFGLTGAKMSNTLMIGYMTKSRLFLFDSIFVGPLLLLTNAALTSPVPDAVLLWIVLIYCAVNVVRYLSIVSLQICDLSKLNCFGPYKAESANTK